jgi:hypothetical protein
VKEQKINKELHEECEAIKSGIDSKSLRETHRLGENCYGEPS